MKTNHFSFSDAPQVDIRVLRTKAGRGHADGLKSSHGSSSSGGASSSEAMSGMSSSSGESEPHIREGDEVLIECRIRANPVVNHMHWLLNRAPLASDPVKGK